MPEKENPSVSNGRSSEHTHEPYFITTPTAPSHPIEISRRLPDRIISLHSDLGVFSHAHVDPGTLALLRTAPNPPSCGNLLDLGCGYGPITVTLAFALSPMPNMGD